MYKKPALYGENVYFFLFKYVQLFKHEQKLSFVFQNVQLNNLIFFLASQPFCLRNRCSLIMYIFCSIICVRFFN